MKQFKKCLMERNKELISIFLVYQCDYFKGYTPEEMESIFRSNPFKVKTIMYDGYLKGI